MQLPAIDTQHIWNFTTRFIASSSISGNLTIAHLIDIFCFAATTVLVYSPFASVRLKMLRLLAPVTTQGTSVTLWLRPATVDSSINSFNVLPEIIVDTSASIDRPAYARVKPSPESPLGSWHWTTSTSTNLIFISAPQGTTMDIELEAVPNRGQAPLGYTRAVAGATVGQIYSATIITSFVPVGVNAI